MNAALQKAFEAYWKKSHPGRDYPRKKWLLRSDTWSSGGYEQPVVHFDWLAFKAGAEWQEKQS